jgi:cellulose synthase/poly-beta-1,6-N-acetylglucosamine synthase-like glycosyltransferase
MASIHLTLLYTVWFLLTYFFMLTILTFLTNKKEFHKAPQKAALDLPRVSILVPAYNEERCIADTIESCLGVNYPKDKLDVIVVNDGSKDRTGEICRRYADEGKIIYLENRPNQGKSVALNKGFAEARTEYVATIDADTVVEADIIHKTLPYFSSPEIAAVTVAIKVKEANNLLQKVVMIEYELGNGFYNKILSYLNCLFVTPGQFSIYRRASVLEVGGFDKTNIVEDTEIAYRMHKHGMRIACCTTAKAYTLVPSTARDLYYQRKRWYTGTIQTIMQHRDVIFNRRLGAFGMYFVPFNYGGTIFATLLSLSLVRIILHNASLSLSNLLLIQFDVMPMISAAIRNQAIDPYQVSMYLFLGLTPLCLHIIASYLGLKTMGNRVRDNLPGFVGFMFFFIPYQVMWLLCMYFAAFRREVKWRAGM